VSLGPAVGGCHARYISISLKVPISLKGRFLDFRGDASARSKARPVWRFRSPHHSCGDSKMRTSKPKPHWINKLLVSFDSEVRKRECRTMVRTSESGH
jgi:hypothetical protein